MFLKPHGNNFEQKYWQPNTLEPSTLGPIDWQKKTGLTNEQYKLEQEEWLTDHYDKFETEIVTENNILPADIKLEIRYHYIFNNEYGTNKVKIKFLERNLLERHRISDFLKNKIKNETISVDLPNADEVFDIHVFIDLNDAESAKWFDSYYSELDKNYTQPINIKSMKVNTLYKFVYPTNEIEFKIVYTYRDIQQISRDVKVFEKVRPRGGRRKRQSTRLHKSKSYCHRKNCLNVRKFTQKRCR